jgi:hypothetical protein
MNLCMYEADTKLSTISIDTQDIRFYLNGFIKEYIDFKRRNII